MAGSGASVPTFHAWTAGGAAKRSTVATALGNICISAAHFLTAAAETALVQSAAQILLAEHVGCLARGCVLGIACVGHVVGERIVNAVVAIARNAIVAVVTVARRTGARVGVVVVTVAVVVLVAATSLAVTAVW